MITQQTTDGRAMGRDGENSERSSTHNSPSLTTFAHTFCEATRAAAMQQAGLPSFFLAKTMLHEVAPRNPCYVFQCLADPAGTRVAGAHFASEWPQNLR